MLTEQHKEVTKHFRKRLSVARIKAHCSAYVSCNVQYIRVNPITLDARFSEEEQQVICRIAIANHLTLGNGMKIDIEQGTYGPGVNFVFRIDILKGEFYESGKPRIFKQSPSWTVYQN